MKSKNLNLTILTLIIIDCFIFYKYIFITKELNNINYGNNNTTILKPDETDKPIVPEQSEKPIEPEKPIESDKPNKPKYNYSKIDLSIKNDVVKNSKIVMPKKLSENFNTKTPDRHLIFLKKNDSQENYTKVNIFIKNNESYFSFKNKNVKIPIKHIKEAHIMYGINGCDISSYFIILLTNDGDIYYFNEWYNNVRINKDFENEDDIIESLKIISNSFIKINKNLKYSELLYIIYPTRMSCGTSFDLLGKNEQGIFKIKNEEIFNFKVYDKVACNRKNYDLSDNCYLINEEKELVNESQLYSYNLSLKFLLDDYVITNENELYLKYYDKTEHTNKHTFIGKIKDLYFDKEFKMVKFIFENNDILEYHYKNVNY